MSLKKILIFIFFFFITFLNVNAKEEYLKNILIDNVALEGFDSEKTDYSVEVGKDKETVKIIFDYDKKIYREKIVANYENGSVKLNYGTNKVSFTLTSQDDIDNSKTYTLTITREDGRSDNNSLSSLTVGGKKINLTDKTDYEVEVDNSLKRVEVTAVLSDQTAKFVEGYGERTGANAVTLSGEKTKFEVKVQAENESIKTYNITVVKTNYQSSDATLKSLKIDNIDFTFKSNVYEYTLNVLNEIASIIITPIKNHEKATLEYPEKINLQTGLNNIVVKVKAEDGTEKEYKLNITRLEKVPLTANIEITGIEFEFKPEVFEYEIETELNTLDFKVTLTSETATSTILNNENLINGSVVKIEIKDGEETEVYSFKIINSLDTQNDEDKKEEKNKINEFLKKYEMYIGLGTFGIGLLSLLVAILTKPKSQIM